MFFTHVTVFDVEDCVPAGVVVSVTTFVLFLRNWCRTLTPEPDDPSPKFQLYAVAPVEPLALKEHVRLLAQLNVKLATDGVEPPPPAEPV